MSGSNVINIKNTYGAVDQIKNIKTKQFFTKVVLFYLKD